MRDNQPHRRSTEELDENVDEQLLDVIGQTHDFETQQKRLELIAMSVPDITVARRLYNILFPITADVGRRG